MADNTHIEWTDATWNPITGCSVVSPGCTNCYAMRLAGGRLKHTASRQGLTTPSKAGPVWNGQLRFNAAELVKPLSCRRPRKIFVCAHGDLFHASVPDAWIDQVFAVAALSPQHTFQVLTKRAERMRAYVTDPDTPARIIDAALRMKALPRDWQWPLPNVWLGVSAEDQARADERIPALLATPAAVHFLSAEPLLNAIDLTEIRWAKSCDCPDSDPTLNALDGTVYCAGCCEGHERLNIGTLNWVIVGGESGPGARPMHPDWARQIRDDCAAAGVAFFFKQWGAWSATGPHNRDMLIGQDGSVAHPRFQTAAVENPNGQGRTILTRVGKKAAGRLLDGVQHDGMPGGR
ncbi:MAG: phage Gp37/Gp68 family protein [Caulobacter sp.]|nr:phage Gp37/Gp68 family protein [Caulobacter sp.]